MTQPSKRPRPGSFPALPVIGLMLRMALGVALMNTGLISYLIQKNGGMQGGSRNAFANPYMMMGIMGNGGVPGMQDYIQFLAPIQVALGLALILGFFTTWAATLAGFLTFLPSAVHIVLLVSTAESSLEVLMGSLLGTMSSVGNTVNVFLASAVVWLASEGKNPFSLDALIFKPGRAVLSAPSGGFQDPVPASVPQGLLITKFDPDIAVDGSNPARD